MALALRGLKPNFRRIFGSRTNPAVFVALCVLLSGPALLAADGVLLEIDPGPAPGEVTLTWTGGEGAFFVYRSSDPNSVTDPKNQLVKTSDRQWIDSPAPGAIWFYLVQGRLCASPGDCSTGYCVDEVCCDAPCSDVCRSCDQPGLGGTCVFAQDGTDPEGECAAPQTCDGFGACSDEDASLLSGPLGEPLALHYDDAVTAPVAVLDWAIEDGGTSDGLPVRVESLSVSVGGTGDASDHAWSLDGPGASGLPGTVSGSPGLQTIAFDNINLQIPDLVAETFTLLVQWGANPVNTRHQDTFSLAVSTGSILLDSGTRFGQSATIDNGGGLVYLDELRIALSSTASGCFGEGTAWVDPRGGFPPYSILWSPTGDTTELIDSLVPGTYSVLVDDSGGGQLSDSIDVTSGACWEACPNDNTNLGTFALPSCDGQSYGTPTVLHGGDSITLEIEAGHTYTVDTCLDPEPGLLLFDTMLTLYNLQRSGEFMIFNDDLELACPVSSSLSGVTFVASTTGPVEVVLDQWALGGECAVSRPKEATYIRIRCEP